MVPPCSPVSVEAAPPLPLPLPPAAAVHWLWLRHLGCQEGRGTPRGHPQTLDNRGLVGRCNMYTRVVSGAQEGRGRGRGNNTKGRGLERERERERRVACSYLLLSYVPCPAPPPIPPTLLKGPRPHRPALWRQPQQLKLHHTSGHHHGPHVHLPLIQEDVIALLPQRRPRPGGQGSGWTGKRLEEGDGLQLASSWGALTVQYFTVNILHTFLYKHSTHTYECHRNKVCSSPTSVLVSLHLHNMHTRIVSGAQEGRERGRGNNTKEGTHF